MPDPAPRRHRVAAPGSSVPRPVGTAAVADNAIEAVQIGMASGFGVTDFERGERHGKLSQAPHLVPHIEPDAANIGGTN